MYILSVPLGTAADIQLQARARGKGHSASDEAARIIVDALNAKSDGPRALYHVIWAPGDTRLHPVVISGIEAGERLPVYAMLMQRDTLHLVVSDTDGRICTVPSSFCVLEVVKTEARLSPRSSVMPSIRRHEMAAAKRLLDWITGVEPENQFMVQASAQLVRNAAVEMANAKGTERPYDLDDVHTVLMACLWGLRQADADNVGE